MAFVSPCGTHSLFLPNKVIQGEIVSFGRAAFEQFLSQDMRLWAQTETWEVPSEHL